LAAATFVSSSGAPEKPLLDSMKFKVYFPPFAVSPFSQTLEDATVCIMIITNLPYFPASKMLERK
jgi:hypothetical protein